nr:putative aspartate-semialdehyde dehydrogenase [uncultured bacterium]
MSKKLRVAIVGATGAVGEAFLSILAERDLPVERVYPLASERSVNDTVTFGRKDLDVQDVAGFDFSSADFALFSAGSAVSEFYAPRAVAAGCTVIDNSSHFRYDENIPLVVPEVNGEILEHFSMPGIVANPNCSTIQMVVALAPIHRAAGISRINVATYQSVSGAGRKALEELAQQTAGRLTFKTDEPVVFQQPIAFNALPQIDALQENDYSREEMKMHWESQKIFADPDLQVNATAVRIPVFFGHGEAVHLETRNAISIEQVRQLMLAAPGVSYSEAQSDHAHPTQLTHAAGSDHVFVGRLRRDHTCERGINMWIVSDNIRKGAALNAIQIMELLADN